MKVFRNIAGALALFGATAGLAAGSAAASDNHWGGLYIGATAGWIGSDIGWTYHDPAGAIADRPIRSAESDGFLGGGVVGFQHQMGQFVVGVEGSLSGLPGDADWGTRPCFNAAFNCQSRIDGLVVTLGGRLGWAPSEHWMVFLSGGAATAAVETREVNVATGLPNQFGTRDRHWGWYIGGGVEYAINHNISLGVEYQHLDLDAETHFSSVAAEHRRIDVDADVVKARLTFKLGRREEHHESMK